MSVKKRNSQGLSHRALRLNEVVGLCVDEEESAKEKERKVSKVG